ncbi:hypothetical protein L0F63_005696 [Massospora cicadina]|nr:hypothetical protein L0F63_005696 [Massospora cicadina]
MRPIRRHYGIHYRPGDPLASELARVTFSGSEHHPNPMVHDSGGENRCRDNDGASESFAWALREVNLRLHAELVADSKGEVNVGANAPLPLRGLQGCTSMARVMPAPEVIVAQLGRGAKLDRAGFLGGLRLAYYIINGQLYLWNLQARKYYAIPQRRKVEAVGLLKPKPEVFKPEIQYLLVVAGGGFVSLTGISVGCDNGILLHKLNQEAATEDDFIITSVVGTASGRIFLGDAKGDVLEMLYQEKINRIRGCQMVNQTKTFLVRVAGFLGVLNPPTADQAIGSLVVDNQRHVLYALSLDSCIKVVNLGGTGASFGLVQVWKAPPQQMIASMQVVPKGEAFPVRLMAITTTGACMELRSVETGDAPCAGELECAYTRPPLFAARSGILSAYSRGALLVSGASGPTSLGIQFPESIMARARVVDQCAVWQSDTELFSITPRDVGVGPYLDDVFGQYHLPARRFDALGSDGLWEIVKLRPVDQLVQILGSNHSPWIPFKAFVESYGASEVCAMGLAILSELPLALMPDDSSVDGSSSIPKAFPLDPTLVKRLHAMFCEISCLSPSASQLPNFVSGTLALTSHILVPVFQVPLFQAGASRRELAISPRTLASTHRCLASLLATLKGPPFNALDFQDDQKLLVQLGRFLSTASDCLGLLLMLIDLNLGLHLECLPTGFWEHAGDCTLEAMLTELKPLVIELAVQVIKSEPSVWIPSKSIADRAGASYGRYLTSSCTRLCKGYELLMAAQNTPIGTECDRLLCEAMGSFSLALPALSLQRLSELVLDFCRLQRPQYALQLLGKCVPAFKIPSGDQSSLEFSALCELLWAPLNALKASSPALLYEAVSAALSTEDLNLHHAIYRYFLELKDPEALYKIPTPFLASYLRTAPTLENTNRLVEYLIRNRKYTDAATTLVGFATSNELAGLKVTLTLPRIDLPLQERLGHLVKAQEIATENTDGAEARATCRTQIEQTLKDLAFQLHVVSEYRSFTNSGEAQSRAEMLDKRLYSPSMLRDEILGSPTLVISKLLVLQQAPCGDTANLKRRAVALGIPLARSLLRRMLEISKVVRPDALAFPLAVVSKALINLAFQMPDQITPQWCAHALLECGAAFNRVVSVLESFLMIKAHPYDSPYLLRIIFLVLSHVLLTWRHKFPRDLSPDEIISPAHVQTFNEGLNFGREVVSDLTPEVEALVKGLDVGR